MLLQLEIEYNNLFEPERILFHTRESIPFGTIYSNGKWISHRYRELFQHIAFQNRDPPTEVRIGAYKFQKNKTEHIIVL
jgi:hypothetical protein